MSYIGTLQIKAVMLLGNGHVDVLKQKAYLSHEMTMGYFP